MQTAAEALERGAAEADPALGQRLVGGLVGHTRRLARLADDLLELARWRAVGCASTPRTMDLADVVAAGPRRVDAPRRRRRGIDLAVAAAAPGRLPVRATPMRLTQALGNLVENALKYAGDGGRVRDRRCAATADRYEVAVRTRARASRSTALPRVFERYFRVEGRGGGGPGGMGLGLAIARGIVLAHGGELTAETGPRGARFVLRLPGAGMENRAGPGRLRPGPAPLRRSAPRRPSDRSRSP